MKDSLLLISKIRSTFINISYDQLTDFEDYYKENPKHFYSHRKDFISITDKPDPLMAFLNENYLKRRQPDILTASNQYFSWYRYERSLDTKGFGRDTPKLGIVTIENRDWIRLVSGNSIVLFATDNNEMHDYRSVEFKNTGISLYVRSSSGYGDYSFPRPDSQAVTPHLEDVNLIKQFPEYKYIDFSIFKMLNWYHMIENRFNKQYLWQVEMLIKGGFNRLADEVHRTSTMMDFKVFSKYQDFFKKTKNGLDNWNRIINCRKIGLEDPEFIYLDGGVWITSSYHSEVNWLELLKKHPEIKRDRFLKYINRRKYKETIFPKHSFIKVYYIYLLILEKLKLNLAKDKYCFPEDLENSMIDVLNTINPYDLKLKLVSEMFDLWQATLPVDEQHNQYILEADRLRILRNEQTRQRRQFEAQQEKAAKERAKKVEQGLAILFDFNKNLHVQIDDTYVLVAPTSKEDLLIEGKTLNHCVYSYLNRMGFLETTILFLRKKGYEDSPYYTVEIKDGQITQCRSTNNQDPANIVNYLKDWFETVKNKIQVQPS
jgi:hypothetical protein